MDIITENNSTAKSITHMIRVCIGKYYQTTLWYLSQRVVHKIHRFLSKDRTIFIPCVVDDTHGINMVLSYMMTAFYPK